MKNKYELEKIVKGFSNHRRIEILHLLNQRPNLSIFEISDILNVNFKTISEHVRRLAIAGLVRKRNEGNNVRHTLSDRGKSILKFLRTLE
jgi:DNA-binding transcriptional ArsR family regulator